MTIKDWKEIGIVAAVTATVTVGVLSTRPGMSVDQQPAVKPVLPTATVGRLTVTASAHTDPAAGNVRATVHITNPTNETQAGKFKVILTKMTFVGSLGSRVMSPSDYKATQVGANAVDRSVAANGSVDVTVDFKTTAQPAGQPQSTPSYQIGIESKGKQSLLGWATLDPPAKPSSVAQAGGFGANVR